MEESSPIGKKTLWQKGEIPRYEQISPFCSVFITFVLQTNKFQGLFGNRLRYHIITDR